jgi:hypothetical protein
VTRFSDDFEHPFTIGVNHTSASFWRDVLVLCLARIEEGQELLVPFDPQELNLKHAVVLAAASTQQVADVHFALVAIRNTIRVLEDKLKVSADASLKALEKEFRESFPDAWNLRDILEHLLDYANGEGKLQRRGEMPTSENIPNLVYGSTRDPGAEVVLMFNFEARNIRVKEALRKAIEIAEHLSELERGEGDRQ